MKLSFLPVPGHMVNRPGGRSVGAPPRYVGRKFVSVEDKDAGVAGSYPAAEEPEVFNLKPSDPEFFDLTRYCLKGGLWPADEATAQACGVRFLKLKRDSESGEWFPEVESKPRERRNVDGSPAVDQE